MAFIISSEVKNVCFKSGEARNQKHFLSLHVIKCHIHDKILKKKKILYNFEA